MSNNRIQQVSHTQTVARQTPNNDFGTVMARTVGEVVRQGAGVLGGVAGGAALSTAVAGIQKTLGVTAASTASGAGPVGTSAFAQGVAPVGSAGVAAPSRHVPMAGGQGDSWSLLEAQKLMQEDGRSFNVAYLQLQNEMQRESREHNAISNIMKVRHDSAKAAINNIR